MENSKGKSILVFNEIKVDWGIQLLISTLDWRGHIQAPAALSQRNSSGYQLCRKLGGPQSLSENSRDKITRAPMGERNIYFLVIVVLAYPTIGDKMTILKWTLTE